MNTQELCDELIRLGKSVQNKKENFLDRVRDTDYVLIDDKLYYEDSFKDEYLAYLNYLQDEVCRIKDNL